MEGWTMNMNKQFRTFDSNFNYLSMLDKCCNILYEGWLICLVSSILCVSLLRSRKSADYRLIDLQSQSNTQFSVTLVLNRFPHYHWG